MVKLGTVPINFLQSMKLNINVVGKKIKVEQDRRTCIWPDVEVFDSSPTIHRFALDYPIGIVGGHPIHLHQLQEVLHLPTHPLLLLTSSILRKSGARITVPDVARLVCTTIPLPYSVFIDHVEVIFEDILCKYPFGEPLVTAALLREVGAIVCCHRHQ